MDSSVLGHFIGILEALGRGEWKARTGLDHDGSDIGRLARAIDLLAEEAMVRRRHIEQVTAQARRVNRALRTLSASNRALLRVTDDEDAQLREVCRLVVEVGGHSFAWVGFVEGQGKALRPMASFGPARAYLDQAGERSDDGGWSRDVGGRAVQTGSPALSRDIANDPEMALWRELALAHGFNSALGLPMRVAGEVVGALVIYASQTDAFDEDEVELLTETADDLSFAVESVRNRKRQREAEEAVRRVSRQNELILDSAGDGIYGVDDAGLINFINPAAATMLGHSREAVLGCDAHATFHHSAPDGTALPRHDCPICAFIASGMPVLGKEEVFWRKDGLALAVECSATPIIEDGEPRGAVVTLKDVSERKHYLAQLERKSNFDDLTGLPNRNLLMDRIAQAVAASQIRQATLALFVANLDRFKEINNSLGRTHGDEALREVAARLRQAIDEADTLARAEGDGFVVVKEVASPEAAASFAQRIRSALSGAFCVGGEEFFLTCSIGIAVFPKDGEYAERLLDHAGIAMYQAKAAGGNAHRFYGEEMNARSMRRLGLENDLRRALERNELELHYQPQVNLRSGEIVGTEALLRWHHPVRGMVMPGEFIPIAEESGLILPIGEWVLRTACAQNKAWQDASLPPVVVAVNMSGRQFASLDVADLTGQVLRETRLDPHYLELELTESTVMEDAAAFTLAMRKLKGLSITLSIDDFGTGYSSLAYLKRFSIDRLKIDQSFVRDIIHDPNDAAIAQAVIALSHSLKLSVLAEGVENESQLQFLRARGCDEMQGYHFSKPVPAAEFEAMLRQRRRLDVVSSGLDAHQCVLLVDDEPSVLAALKRVLRREGYRILTANSAREGLEQLALHSVGVVVSDGRMPHMTGAEFMGRVRDMYPATVRIMLSGYTELNAVTDAVNKGEIFKFLTKPWDDRELVETLRNAFRYYQSRQMEQALHLA